MLHLALLAGLSLSPLSGAIDGRDNIAWHGGSYADALRAAKQSNTLVMIEFWADWCGWCERHADENLNDKTILAAMADFIPFSAELSVDANGEYVDGGAADLMKRFGVRRFPTIVFVRPDGRPEDLVSGFLSAPALAKEIARIRRGENTILYFERKMQAEPAELEWRWKYAQKLDSLGDAAGYQREITFIEAADPGRLSIPSRRMDLRILMEELGGCMRDPELSPDPVGLERFLRNETHPELLCDGWLLMGAVQRELGRASAARNAYRAAWGAVEDDRVASIGNGIAWTYWTERNQLEREDKEFALRVAIEATSAFEKENFDPVARAMFYDTLACCYYMNGKRTKALVLMRRCVENDPDSSEYAERLAQFEARG